MIFHLHAQRPTDAGEDAGEGGDQRASTAAAGFIGTTWPVTHDGRGGVSVEIDGKCLMTGKSSRHRS